MARSKGLGPRSASCFALSSLLILSTSALSLTSDKSSAMILSLTYVVRVYLGTKSPIIDITVGVWISILQALKFGIIDSCAKREKT